MPWLSAALIVDAAGVEALSDALLEAGALSVDVADAASGTAWERPIFDEPDTAPKVWPRARVSALFDVGADVPAAVKAAHGAAGLAPPDDCEVTRIEDDDWVRRTQSQFTPQHVTARLWVVPTWHAPPDPHALNIVLDPGLAFGTGAHPTTRLCLQWLDDRISGGEAVIDFGCGSGILAIAALKLGAARACGVDIDADAVVAARRNAEQNAVHARFVSAAEDVGGPADIVVANILAQPLRVLAPLVAKLTTRGWRLALSGILAEQAAEVQEAYGAWYDFEPCREADGWILLSAIRR